MPQRHPLEGRHIDPTELYQYLVNAQTNRVRNIQDDTIRNSLLRVYHHVNSLLEKIWQELDETEVSNFKATFALSIPTITSSEGETPPPNITTWYEYFMHTSQSLEPYNKDPSAREIQIWISQQIISIISGDDHRTRWELSQLAPVSFIPNNIVNEHPGLIRSYLFYLSHDLSQCVQKHDFTTAQSIMNRIMELYVQHSELESINIAQWSWSEGEKVHPTDIAYSLFMNEIMDKYIYLLCRTGRKKEAEKWFGVVADMEAQNNFHSPSHLMHTILFFKDENYTLEWVDAKIEQLEQGGEGYFGYNVQREAPVYYATLLGELELLRLKKYWGTNEYDDRRRYFIQQCSHLFDAVSLQNKKELVAHLLEFEGEQETPGTQSIQKFQAAEDLYQGNADLDFHRAECMLRGLTHNFIALQEQDPKAENIKAKMIKAWNILERSVGRSMVDFVDIFSEERFSLSDPLTGETLQQLKVQISACLQKRQDEFPDDEKFFFPEVFTDILILWILLYRTTPSNTSGIIRMKALRDAADYNSKHIKSVAQSEGVGEENIPSSPHTFIDFIAGRFSCEHAVLLSYEEGNLKCMAHHSPVTQEEFFNNPHLISATQEAILEGKGKKLPLILLNPPHHIAELEIIVSGNKALLLECSRTRQTLTQFELSILHNHLEHFDTLTPSESWEEFLCRGVSIQIVKPGDPLFEQAVRLNKNIYAEIMGITHTVTIPEHGFVCLVRDAQVIGGASVNMLELGKSKVEIYPQVTDDTGNLTSGFKELFTQTTDTGKQFGKAVEIGNVFMDPLYRPLQDLLYYACFQRGVFLTEKEAEHFGRAITIENHRAIMTANRMIRIALSRLGLSMEDFGKIPLDDEFFARILKRGFSPAELETYIATYFKGQDPHIITIPHTQGSKVRDTFKAGSRKQKIAEQFTGGSNSEILRF